MGWPITVRVGILNTGETVVNVPDGESFGVTMRARRVDQQAVAAPEAAPEAAPAAAPASAEGGEAAAPASGEGAGAPAAEGGAPPAVEAAPPPPPAPPPIECEAIPAGSPQDGVAPLATGSSAYRSIQIDRQCPLNEAGRYLIEVTVEVPEVEGGDIHGALAPVTLPIEITLPDPPVVARVEAQSSYTLGQPFEVTARVTNYGAEPVWIISSRGMLVRLRAESDSEAVPCTDPRRGRGARGRLAPGASQEVTVNLAERCQLALPGRYTITPQIELPRAGANAFTGTLDAAPFVIEVVSNE
jgi:hypothetical protein